MERDDALSRGLNHGLDKIYDALDNSTITETRDALDQRENEVRGLLKGIEQHARWIVDQGYGASVDDIIDAGHIVRLCRLVPLAVAPAVTQYATAIRNRCHDLPDIRSACDSIVEKADAVQRAMGELRKAEAIIGKHLAGFYELGRETGR